MRPIINFIRHSLRWEFSAFVLWFSALTFLCVAFYTFAPSFRLGFYEVYTAGIVGLAFVASAASVRLAPAEKSKIDARELGFGALVFLFGLALGLYRLDFYSIWLDEEVQAFSTRAWPGFSIVGRSVLSQQMPLGYFFTALNWDFGGTYEWKLRFLACLFMAGSGVLFFRIAKRLCRNPLIYSAAPFVYLLNPWIIRYAQEGRPYGIMMFCCLLWLNSVHDLFSGKSGQGELLRPSLVVFCSSLLFLLSASFQPVIFCASFLFVSSPLLFFNAWRRTAQAFFGSVALAALAVLPLVGLARSASVRFLNPNESFSSWLSLVQGIPTFATQAKSLFLEQSYFLVLVFIFAPFTLVRPGKKEHGLIWAGMAICLAYALLFWSSFSLLIDYPLFIRYLLSFYPLGLLLILAYFDQLSSFFGGGRARYLKWGWQLFFLAALVSSPLKALPDAYFSTKFDRWNVDFKSIYYFFRQTGLTGDLGYTIPYLSPKHWEQNGFLATDFYYRENTPVQVLSYQRNPEGQTVADLMMKDFSHYKPRQIYFTFLNLSETDASSVLKFCSSGSGIDPKSGDRFVICKVSVKDDFPKSVDRFFSGLVHSLEDKEKAYRMYDILLRVAEFEGNRPRCEARLQELKSLSSKFERVQQIVRVHETRCAAIGPGPAGRTKSR